MALSSLGCGAAVLLLTCASSPASVSFSRKRRRVFGRPERCRSAASSGFFLKMPEYSHLSLSAALGFLMQRLGMELKQVSADSCRHGDGPEGFDWLTVSAPGFLVLARLLR